MTRMYRVRVASTGWNGSPGLNTFYFSNIATPDSSDSTHADTCVALVQAALAAHTDIFPADHIFTVSPVVDVIDPINGELLDSYAGSAPADIHGSGTGEYGPQAAMVVGSLLTSSFVGGHRVRGRAFWGPLKALNDADGTPTADLVASVEGLRTTLTSGGTDVKSVVWSRPRTAVPLRVPPITARDGSAQPTTAISVRDSWAVLRSRRG